MTPFIMIAGIAGFVTLLLPDVCRILRRHCLALPASFLGYTAVGIALALQAASFAPSGPVGVRIAGAVGAGIFAMLLLYSAILEIPLRSRSPARGAPALYRAGTYRFSRHPGLLWFLLMQLCLNAVYHEGSFFLASLALVLGDLALVAVQDRYLFPRLFPGYREYQRSVPFLFPRLRFGRGVSI